MSFPVRFQYLGKLITGKSSIPRRIGSPAVHCNFSFCSPHLCRNPISIKLARPYAGQGLLKIEKLRPSRVIRRVQRYGRLRHSLTPYEKRAFFPRFDKVVSHCRSCLRLQHTDTSSWSPVRESRQGCRCAGKVWPSLAKIEECFTSALACFLTSEVTRIVDMRPRQGSQNRNQLYGNRELEKWETRCGRSLWECGSTAPPP